jgi:hypothetical protein
MLTKPLRRMERLSCWASINSIERMLLGFKKGHMPSITNNRANATSKSCHICHSPKKNRGLPGPVFAALAGRRSFSQSEHLLSINKPQGSVTLEKFRGDYLSQGLPRLHRALKAGYLGKLLTRTVFQIAEKVRIRLQHHYIRRAVKAAFVGIQTAVEGVELAVLLIGMSIDFRSLAITLTT